MTISRQDPGATQAHLASRLALTLEMMIVTNKHKQDQVNNANSAFIFMINIFIIQGCQSGSVGRDGQTGPVV